VHHSLCAQFWLGVLLLTARASAADDAATTAAPPAGEPPPVQETTVHGTLPDLNGRWLMVATLELPQGGKNTLVSLWEVATRDGQPLLTQRFTELPAPQKAAMEGAGGAGQSWTPTPEDLAAVRAGWATVTPVDSHVKHLQTDISAPDGFDQTLTSEARTKDAILAIRQRHDMHPSAAPVIRFAFVYAALAKTDGGDYTGNFDGAMVAAAPAPIPVAVKGPFHMYRLDPPAPAASPGLLARLLDLFRSSATH